MKMVRVLVQLPKSLKEKLDEERKRGTSAAGLIRHLLEQHFKSKKAA
jgi:metal-responsive CopG/Arc/MetJ family transcriptional regulator